MVAKTFQNLPQVGEPFESGGKMYVNVQSKNGNLRRVRWYEVDEYMKMYPETNRADIDEYYKSMKYTICGAGGFVWVLEGDLASYLDILQMNSNTRYHTHFGWYVRSDVEDYVLDALKEFCVPHKLYWDEVAVDENTLKDKKNVQAYVTKLCGGRPAIEKGY